MADSMAVASSSSMSRNAPVAPSSPPTIFPPSTSLPSQPSTTEKSHFLTPSSPLKRRRSSDLPSTTLAVTRAARVPSPFATSPKLGLLAPTSPQPLTAAAEIAEQKRRKLVAEKAVGRQTSPNPAKAALGALLGRASSEMSRPEDAPEEAAITLNEAILAVAPSITIPPPTLATASLQTSPVSSSSFGTLDSAGALTMAANGAQVASPGGMGDDDDREEGSEEREETSRANSGESHSNKAFTYPGPLLSAQVKDGRRGMSLPGSSRARDESKSPSSSNKKHKCPYCSTEFTRHHNLKSHLLTHSHEKPYMCQTCDSRFRRLHDLKRHTKLHTGERPHICSKCKRSFARGDALARHAKGQGGCAGRRSSVGSFGGDGSGNGGDESIDGMMYGAETSHEPEHMDEDTEGAEEREQGLPSIRRHDAPLDSNYRAQENHSAYQARQPSTYPPVAARQAPPAPMGGLYPPHAGHGAASSTSTSPSIQASPLPSYPPLANASYTAGGPNVFAQGGMTESPKPISPGAMQLGHPESLHRRSPSLTQQFQQQQYGRRPHGHSSPPPMGLLPPPPGSSHSSTSHSLLPHLPSLPGLNPPDPRYTLHSQPGGQASISHHTQQPQPQPGNGSYQSQPGGVISSASNSLSSHGTQAHASGDRGALYISDQERMWAVVRALESKVDKLQEEVVNLRGQLAQAQAQVQGQTHR